ncbi:MAG: Ldh family oxidoreductase [Bacteroidales bacterium]|nr:Ldh family oxidoreductase [Bacteroidales bacterium]
MEKRFNYEQLFAFTVTVLEAMGHSKADAKLGAEVLISADLRGVDSHGVARLRGYIRLWEAKRMNAKPQVRIEHETPSTATVDGDSGLGLVVAPKAMQIAIEKAKNVGTGWVAVNNSNHFGIAGYHAMMALEHDMIGIALTNATPTTAPTFSKQRMLGTNPIAVAVPTGSQPAFVADFSTTAAAVGKLEILQRKQKDAPIGWLQDKEGVPTHDAHGLKSGGSLLPLGSDREHSSHKGYCMGAVVDILTAVLSGANYGPWVPPFLAFMPMPQNPVGKGIGHFVGAMRIDAFRPAADFKLNMDKWIDAFRKAEPIDPKNKVLIPGDLERDFSQDRMKNGIPLLPAVVDDLQDIGKGFGISLI